jgi:GntR family transcriptional regulator
MSEPPLWRRTRDAIVARIVDGEFAAGAMLPSEPELGAQLGVSQGTARKALSELERAGVVERRQGRGTFVPVTTPERALFHFFRLRRPDGSAVTPELVSETLTRRRPRAPERAALGDGPVVEIARLRAVDGRPVARERIVLPAARFPGLADRAPLPNTLYALYQGAYGIAVARAEEALSPVAAGAADAALGMGEGAPLLEVERRAFDIADRVVELRASRYAMEGLRYAVTLR